MSQKATMIRDSSGHYWLQTRDEGGRVRSSYIGAIGNPTAVEAWCAAHGVEVREAGLSVPVRDLGPPLEIAA